MTEPSRSRLPTEAWERLRWARNRKYETGKEAARALGMRPNTYSAYERGPDSSKHTPMTLESAKRFGGEFGVHWMWLLTGEGLTFPARGANAETLIRIIAEIEAAEFADPNRFEQKASDIITLLRTD
jgi:transcriptional regulator with XRE-family HTH domain